jgi:hypothetical protein
MTEKKQLENAINFLKGRSVERKHCKILTHEERFIGLNEFQEVMEMVTEGNFNKFMESTRKVISDEELKNQFDWDFEKPYQPPDSEFQILNS